MSTDPDVSAPILAGLAATLAPGEEGVLADCRIYLHWLAEQRPGALGLSANDDVELRNYLLALRNQGLERPALRQQMASLKRLYAWAAGSGLIAANPFEEFNFDRPLLSRQQIRRREQAQGGDSREREIVRLRALTRLAEQLHQTPDVLGTLATTLRTLVDVMGLKTAWAFVLTGGRNPPLLRRVPEAPHDFALAAACGLPPGLEERDCFYLRDPGDCHCQSLLRAGQLRRAVNVVECTRLQDAAEGAGDNQGLLFHATVPLLVQGQPAGLLNFATDEWQFLTATDLQLLTAVGAHVSLALERALLFDLTQEQRARMETELTMAREVQASLLPPQLPDIPGFALAALWRSAREMAGDFYDVLRLSGGRWGLVIADVSDKGAPAALYMAVVHSLFSARAESASSPADLLAQVNSVLSRQFTSGMFVTVFYGILDPAARTLTYALGGHNPPLIRRADGRVEALPYGGIALGVLEGVRFEDRVVTLGLTEALVAYTDGVTDAENPQRQDYTLARLSAAVAAAPSFQARPLLNAVSADLAAFCQAAPQPDDITLLVVACNAQTTTDDRRRTTDLLEFVLTEE